VAGPGFSTANVGALSVSGQRITVTGVTRTAAQTLIVTYGSGSTATAPSTPGAQTWQVQEASTAAGVLTSIAAPPVIAVESADGSGTLSAGTTNVSASQTGNTIAFTYTAAAGGMSGGTVTIVVPAGWSAPSTTGANPGYTTASTGVVSAAGQTITVSGVTLAGAATMTIVYGSTAGGGPGATAGTTAGANVFQTQQRSTGGGILTSIAAQPTGPGR
jgi:hypothetical protein